MDPEEVDVVVDVAVGNSEILVDSDIKLDAAPVAVEGEPSNVGTEAVSSTEAADPILDPSGPQQSVSAAASETAKGRPDATQGLPSSSDSPNTAELKDSPYTAELKDSPIFTPPQVLGSGKAKVTDGPLDTATPKVNANSKPTDGLNPPSSIRPGGNRGKSPSSMRRASESSPNLPRAKALTPQRKMSLMKKSGAPPTPSKPIEDASVSATRKPDSGTVNLNTIRKRAELGKMGKEDLIDSNLQLELTVLAKNREIQKVVQDVRERLEKADTEKRTLLKQNAELKARMEAESAAQKPSAPAKEGSNANQLRLKDELIQSLQKELDELRNRQSRANAFVPQKLRSAELDSTVGRDGESRSPSLERHESHPKGAVSKTVAPKAKAKTKPKVPSMPKSKMPAPPKKKERSGSITTDRYQLYWPPVSGPPTCTGVHGFKGFTVEESPLLDYGPDLLARLGDPEEESSAEPQSIFDWDGLADNVASVVHGLVEDPKTEWFKKTKKVAPTPGGASNGLKPNPVAPTSLPGQGEGTTTTNRQSVLGKNVSQRLNITLNFFKKTFGPVGGWSAFKKAILQCTLGKEELNLLIDSVPDPEEDRGCRKLTEWNECVAKVQQFRSDNPNVELLEDEEYVYYLSTIPDVHLRLQCMYVKTCFPEILTSLNVKIRHLLLAIKSIRSSIGIRQLFLSILKMGNWMNEGTSAGDRLWFRFSTLERVTESKGSGSKSHSLLQFLAAQLGDIIPERDISLLQKAKEYSLVHTYHMLCHVLNVHSAVNSEGAQKKSKTDDVFSKKRRCSMLPEEEDKNDKFGEQMEAFAEENKELLLNLTEMGCRLTKEYSGLVAYFGDKDTFLPIDRKVQMDGQHLAFVPDLFSRLHDFLSLYKTEAKACEASELHREKSRNYKSRQMSVAVTANDLASALQTPKRSVSTTRGNVASPDRPSGDARRLTPSGSRTPLKGSTPHKGFPMSKECVAAGGVDIDTRYDADLNGKNVSPEEADQSGILGTADTAHPNYACESNELPTDENSEAAINRRPNRREKRMSMRAVMSFATSLHEGTALSGLKHPTAPGGVDDLFLPPRGPVNVAKKVPCLSALNEANPTKFDEGFDPQNLKRI